MNNEMLDLPVPPLPEGFNVDSPITPSFEKVIRIHMKGEEDQGMLVKSDFMMTLDAEQADLILRNMKTSILKYTSDSVSADNLTYRKMIPLLLCNEVLDIIGTTDPDTGISTQISFTEGQHSEAIEYFVVRGKRYDNKEEARKAVHSLTFDNLVEELILDVK
jgi:hypothetical protein